MDADAFAWRTRAEDTAGPEARRGRSKNTLEP